jgi:hypothetical protein
MKRWFVASVTLVAIASSATAQTLKEEYSAYEGGPELVSPLADPHVGGSGSGSGGFVGITAAGTSVGLSFRGVTQYNAASFGLNYIPPDTMGAIGKTQFMETTNGAYAVYDKTTGAVQSMVSMNAFWNTASGGTLTSSNGDSRVMFDAPSQKWIVMSFAASVADIQIAVSNTSDAMGGWKTTKFTGFAGGVADYPTLAIDKDAVYIGTNNFGGPSTSFQGTTMNVISRADLLGAGAPTAANVKQFVTPFTGNPVTDVDRGYAIQGVNSTGPVSGRLLGSSLYYADMARTQITGAGTAGATIGASSYLGLTGYDGNGPGRQPDALNTGNKRVIDTGDDRVAASVWEKNGRIYAVHTVTQTGTDNTAVRWVVTDAATGAVIQEGDIADPDHDYYQASLAVNSEGEVVIGYNRSGFGPDGKITFMATTFMSHNDGSLFETDEIVLHVSDVDSYHNGSIDGRPAAGRQRWGDYSAVTLDPENDMSFWAIGEYADNFNDAAGGHPGGSGGSRWGTWIAEINLAGQVPEPESLALVLAALMAMGITVRRKSAGV